MSTKQRRPRPPVQQQPGPSGSDQGAQAPAERGEDGEKIGSHKDIITITSSIPTARGLFGTLAFLYGLLSEVNSQTLADMTDSAMRMDVTKTHGMS